MAGVTQAEQLQAFRDTAAEVAAGRMGAAEARQRMREALADMNYQAHPGQEGSIKDLSSTRRLQVAIDTNVDLARGWAQHRTSMQNYVRPAQELYRAGRVKKPRDWRKKWAEAAAAVGWEGVSRKREFVALKTSPIWRALSRFDQPYPPFDFGSKMRVRSLSMKDAQEAGLLTEPEELAEKQEQQRKEALLSMNENVECTPQVSDRELRKQLADVLQGLAEWKGDTLVMTDPNGTRPYPPEEIGRVITAPLPNGFENRQAQAFRDWTADSRYYDPPKKDDTPQERKAKASEDEKEDLYRLFGRIESQPSEIKLSRGLHFSTQKDIDKFESIIDSQGYYSPLKGKIADSFTINEDISDFYAGKSSLQVKVEVVKHKTAKDLRPLYDAIQPEKQIPYHPLRLEAEFVFLGGTKLRVIKKVKEKWEGGKRITYYTEEI